MTRSKDSIYANALDGIEAFKFDAKVAAFFPDMIQRSLPGYQAIIAAIGLLAGRFARSNSICHHLDCSLGAAALSMLRLNAPNCRIIAVDHSAAMISRFHERLQKDAPNANVEIRCVDIRDQKRSTLENILIPETFKTHLNRLLKAGFNSADVWLQYFNFASILALK